MNHDNKKNTMKAYDRPQDPGHDGAGWTFETAEHGGALPDSMPQVILATDQYGRKAVYVPVIDGSFEQSVTPAIDWLRGYGNPHARIVVEQMGAELLVGEKSFPVPFDGALNIRAIS